MREIKFCSVIMCCVYLSFDAINKMSVIFYLSLIQAWWKDIDMEAWAGFLNLGFLDLQGENPIEC